MHKNYKIALSLVHSLWDSVTRTLQAAAQYSLYTRELGDQIVASQVKVHSPDFFVVITILPYVILRKRRLFFLLGKEQLEFLSMLPFSVCKR